MSALVATWIHVFALVCLYIEHTEASKEPPHVKPCPEDYFAAVKSCYKVGEVGPYQSTQCEYVKIESKEENDYIRGLINEIGDDSVWIGNMEIDGDYHRYIEHRDRASCHVMYNDGYWEALPSYSCHQHRKPVCEIEQQCEFNWVGENCDRQCHCYKHNCTFNSCLYGCQPGWEGALCDEETHKPHVEHYCFKNSTHYALRLSMDLKNDFKSLVPIDDEGSPINQDNYTTEYPVGLNTLELTTEDLSNSFQPNYYEKKIDDPAIFEWSFRLLELNSVRLPNDLDFRVQCNFSEADIWYSSVSLDFNPKAMTEQTPEPRQISVKMFLTDPDTIEPKSNFTLGQPVRLALKTESDKEELTFSPRNCKARSKDGLVERQLSDQHGCPIEKEIFKEFRQKSSGEMVTGYFKAFGLPGYTTYEISCDLVACYGQIICLEACNRFGRSERSVMGIQDPIFTVVKTSVTVK